MGSIYYRKKLTWKNLLNKLTKEFEIYVRISNDKAYPLIFEELLFCIGGESIEEDLKALQVQISEIMQEYSPNDYHREIFNLKNTNSSRQIMIMLLKELKRRIIKARQHREKVENIATVENEETQ